MNYKPELGINTPLLILFLAFLSANSHECGDISDLAIDDCVSDDSICAYCPSTKACIEFDACNNRTTVICPNFIPSNMECEYSSRSQDHTIISFIGSASLVSTFTLLVSSLKRCKCRKATSNTKKLYVMTFIIAIAGLMVGFDELEINGYTWIYQVCSWISLCFIAITVLFGGYFGIKYVYNIHDTKIIQRRIEDDRKTEELLQKLLREANNGEITISDT
jgi:hypothetical protein